MPLALRRGLKECARNILSKIHAGCQSYTPNYASVKGLGLVLTQGRERHHGDGTSCKARTGCAVPRLVGLSKSTLG